MFIIRHKTIFATYFSMRLFSEYALWFFVIIKVAHFIDDRKTEHQKGVFEQIEGEAPIFIVSIEKPAKESHLEVATGPPKYEDLDDLV